MAAGRDPHCLHIQMGGACPSLQLSWISFFTPEALTREDSINCSQQRYHGKDTPATKREKPEQWVSSFHKSQQLN